MKLVMLTEEMSRRFGDEKAVRLIKEAGFDGYDYSMFDHVEDALFNDDGYLDYAKRLRKITDEIGLPCLQAHAPCPTMNKGTIALIPSYIRAIEICDVLGCKTVVVHPDGFLSAKENKECLYDKLMPYAEKYGVTIATENMFKWKDETETETVPAACGTSEDFIEHIDVMNSPYFTGCVDVGHAEMVNCEGATNMLRRLGHDRVGALHIHDNDLYYDLHTTPFVGKINWKEVAKALKDINYCGHFTFENTMFLRNFPDKLIPQCLKLIEKTGRYLVDLIEK